jgi:hypothetical protein
MSGYLTETKVLIAGRMREITDRLGIDASAYRRHVTCPMPGHGGKGDFRCDERKDRAFCTCGTFDSIDLAQALLGFPDLLEAADWCREAIGEPGRGKRPETPEERAQRQRRLEAARVEAERRQEQQEREDAEENRRRVLYVRNVLWASALPAIATPVERYLNSRATHTIPPTVRFLPEYGEGKHPAMIVPFGVAEEPEPGEYRIRQRAITGAHITLLTPDGRKATFLVQHPLCIMCRHHGKLTRATVVDHIIKHNGDPVIFWDKTKWQSLCQPHHDITKQAQEKSGKLSGVDVEGRPTHPDHPWNKKCSDGGGS